jgi:hypothetical protein
MLGVRLPSAAPSGEKPAGSWATVRASAPIRRALVFMSLLNVLDVTVGLTLLLMAHGGWSAFLGDDRAYGVASGALGFGTLAAPALVRCGADSVARARTGMLLMATCVLLTAGSPTVMWALAPLALAGAATVHAESAATGIIQAEAPDEVRAAMLGVADACMVGAALAGALLAPWVASLVSAPALLVVLALVGGAAAAVLRRESGQLRPSTAVPSRSSSVSTVAASPAVANSPAVRSA